MEKIKNKARSVLHYSFEKADKFSITPKLNYKGGAHFTYWGGCISLLLYMTMIGYLAYQVREAFKKPVISAYPLYGQINDVIDMKNMTICVDNGVDNLTTQQMEDVFCLNKYPEERIDEMDTCFSLQKHKYSDFVPQDAKKKARPTGICGTINTTVLLYFNRSRELSMFLYYEYLQISIITNTLTTNETKFGVDESKQIYNYPYSQDFSELTKSYDVIIDKIYYDIRSSPLSLSSTNMSSYAIATGGYSYQEDHYTGISFFYSGHKIITSIRGESIVEIFTALQGIYAPVLLITIILFSRFFRTKYYQDVANRVKDELHPELKKDLRVNPINYALVRLARKFSLKKKKLVPSKMDENVELVKILRDKIEDGLDIINILKILSNSKETEELVKTEILRRKGSLASTAASDSTTPNSRGLNRPATIGGFTPTGRQDLEINRMPSASEETMNNID